MVVFLLVVSISVSACGINKQNDRDIKTYTQSQVYVSSNSEADVNVNNASETEKVVDENQVENNEDIETKTSTVSIAAEALDIGNKAEYIYKDILDMFYQKISYGWEKTEEVSLIFFQGYPQTQTLSGVGYSFVDLDNNGMPELLVTTTQEAMNGMIYDLYSYVDGKIIHLASSMERDRFYLCEDNTIYNEGSGGATVSSAEMFEISSDKHSLSLKEMVVYNEDLNQENPWFYGTEECYDSKFGYNADYLTGITGEEALTIENKYKKKNFAIKLFDSYVPQGDMPVKVKLKQAFKEGIGTETMCCFWCYDFDNNGTEEAFGVTGDSDDAWYLTNTKIYFINHNYEVFCIDEIEDLCGFADITSWDEEYTVLNAKNVKFVCLGGYDGQKTFLYGVRGDKAYQPAVSGKHASFYQLDSGLYIGVPHEGGTEERECYYNFNFETGEFEQAE